MGVLIWGDGFPMNFQHPLMGKLCIGPPNVLEVQEHARGPLSSFEVQVWWGLNLTRLWGGQKRWVVCLFVCLCVHHAFESQIMLLHYAFMWKWCGSWGWDRNLSRFFDIAFMYLHDVITPSCLVYLTFKIFCKVDYNIVIKVLDGQLPFTILLKVSHCC